MQLPALLYTPAGAGFYKMLQEARMNEMNLKPQLPTTNTMINFHTPKKKTERKIDRYYPSVYTDG